MSKIVKTIDIYNVSQQYNSFHDGYSIFVTILNLTKKTINLHITDFYLVQDIEIDFDYWCSGFFPIEGKLKAHETIKSGRLWFRSKLKNRKLSADDYIVVFATDKTNKKKYIYRFDFDGLNWVNSYFIFDKM